MKFDFSKDWCEKMARREMESSISAGAYDHPLRKHEYQVCPHCRNYDLEKSWCSHCNKSGFIKS